MKKICASFWLVLMAAMVSCRTQEDLSLTQKNVRVLPSTASTDAATSLLQDQEAFGGPWSHPMHGFRPPKGIAREEMVDFLVISRPHLRLFQHYDGMRKAGSGLTAMQQSLQAYISAQPISQGQKQILRQQAAILMLNQQLIYADAPDEEKRNLARFYLHELDEAQSVNIYLLEATLNFCGASMPQDAANTLVSNFLHRYQHIARPIPAGTKIPATQNPARKDMMASVAAQYEQQRHQAQPVIDRKSVV